MKKLDREYLNQVIQNKNAVIARLQAELRYLQNKVEEKDADIERLEARLAVNA